MLIFNFGATTGNDFSFFMFNNFFNSNKLIHNNITHRSARVASSFQLEIGEVLVLLKLGNDKISSSLGDFVRGAAVSHLITFGVFSGLALLLGVFLKGKFCDVTKRAISKFQGGTTTTNAVAGGEAKIEKDHQLTVKHIIKKMKQFKEAPALFFAPIPFVVFFLFSLLVSGIADTTVMLAFVGTKYPDSASPGANWFLALTAPIMILILTVVVVWFLMKELGYLQKKDQRKQEEQSSFHLFNRPYMRNPFSGASVFYCKKCSPLKAAKKKKQS